MSDTKEIFILYDEKTASTFTKWKIKENSKVSEQTVICECKSTSNIKIRSKLNGQIIKLIASEGQILQTGDILASVLPCQHETLWRNMCAECGADLKDVKNRSATIAMEHSIPDLLVSEQSAKELGKLEVDNLVKNRKLVLLLDLDQTLIHTTNNNVSNALQDVYHFQLRNLKKQLWYHTKFRPHLRKFLSDISQLYELHICTFGIREYAHIIASFIDPEKKIFQHRILSRDECFHPSLKTLNLKALFPCGDSMVCIVDDREDVWKNAPNLVPVKPYVYFSETGDINAVHLTSNDQKLKNKKLDPSSVHKIKKVVTDEDNRTTLKQNHNVSGSDKIKANSSSSVSNNISSSDYNILIPNNVTNNNLEECKMEVKDNNKELKISRMDLNVIDSNSMDTESTNSNNDDLNAKSISNTHTMAVGEITNPPSSCINVETNILNIARNNLILGDDNKTLINHKIEDERMDTEDVENTNIIKNKENSNSAIINYKNDLNSSKENNLTDCMDITIAETKSSKFTINGNDVVIGVTNNILNDVNNISDTGQMSTKNISSETNMCGEVSSNSIASKITSEIEPSETCIENKKSSEIVNKSETVELNTTEVRISEIEKPLLSSQQLDLNHASNEKLHLFYGVVDVKDSDDYLIYLTEILTRIHVAYYDMHDQSAADVARLGDIDLKKIIPYVRKKVLKNCNLLFSGIHPTNQDFKTTWAYTTAKSLGANIHAKFCTAPEHPTTHLIAARRGTEKYKLAEQHPNVHIVSLEWLRLSSERWTRLDEKLFPLINDISI